MKKHPEYNPFLYISTADLIAWRDEIETKVMEGLGRSIPYDFAMYEKLTTELSARCFRERLELVADNKEVEHWVTVGSLSGLKLELVVNN